MIDFWLYRKEALEHFESADSLEETVEVLRPHVRWALFGVWLVLLVVLAWSFFGRLPEILSAKGILLRDQNNFYIATLIPNADIVLSQNMKARIYSDAEPNPLSSFAGHVATISEFPITEENKKNLLGKFSFVEEYFSVKNSYLVKIAIDPTVAFPQKEPKLVEGEWLDIEITLKYRKPISFLLPFFEPS